MKLTKYILFSLWLSLTACIGLNADTLIWEGDVSSNGSKVNVPGIQPGKVYKVAVSGTMWFGNYWKNGEDLDYDAAYEFNAVKPPPTYIPVFKVIANKSEHPFVSEGTPENYNPSHTYETPPFVINDNKLTLWVFDTDYRENRGQIHAKVYEVAMDDGTAGGGVPQGGFFVAAKWYIPEPVEPLGEGEKYSVYLLEAKEGKKEIKWTPVDDPWFFHLSEDWKNSLNNPKKFDKGKRFSMSGSMVVARPIEGTDGGDGGMESKTIEGAYLFESMGTYGTLDEIKKAHPESDVEANIQKVGEDGAFSGIQATDQGDAGLAGGDIQEGWSDDREQRAIDMLYNLADFYGCFIATAVYQSWDAPELEPLREFRDQILMTSAAGRSLASAYYYWGPRWAHELQDMPVTRTVLRPFISGFSWLMDSLDLSNETTRSVMHSMIDGVAWVLSPWLEEQNEEGSARPIPILAP